MFASTFSEFLCYLSFGFLPFLSFHSQLFNFFPFLCTTTLYSLFIGQKISGILLIWCKSDSLLTNPSSLLFSCLILNYLLQFQVPVFWLLFLSPQVLLGRLDFGGNFLVY